MTFVYVMQRNFSSTCTVEDHWVRHVILDRITIDIVSQMFASTIVGTLSPQRPQKEVKLHPWRWSLLLDCFQHSHLLSTESYPLIFSLKKNRC